MCNVSFNPPPLAHRYGRENMFRSCTQLFQCHVFCCLSSRMRTVFFLGAPYTQMFYIIFYVSFPPTLENKFLHYLPTHALHRPCQNISACLFYVRPEAETNRKSEFCSGDKVDLQREKHVDTKFSQIPYCVLFVFSVSMKNHTKRLMLSLHHKQPRWFILKRIAS